MGLHAPVRKGADMIASKRSKLLAHEGEVARQTAARLIRLLDHDDWKAKRARCYYLGVGRIGAGILGNDNIDGVSADEGDLGLWLERPALLNQLGAWRQRIRRGRLDRADEVAVLGCCAKRADLLAPNREKDAPRPVSERGHCLVRVGNTDPLVVVLLPPRRSHVREERDSRDTRRGDGVRRDARCERVRCVDDCLDGVLLHPLHETIHAAKTAAARRDRRHAWRSRTAGERQRRGEARISGEAPSQLGRFASAAENEDAHERL
jgi:hypothetical protein